MRADVWGDNIYIYPPDMLELKEWLYISLFYIILAYVFITFAGIPLVELSGSSISAVVIIVSWLAIIAYAVTYMVVSRARDSVEQDFEVRWR